MIISKTPVRIEFTGGSDLPAFYRHQTGAIVNVAINRYIYVYARHPEFPMGNKFEFFHERVEKTNNFLELSHVLARETLRHRKIKSLFFGTFADLPSQTGLGSSGSFTVGLLKLLGEINGKEEVGQKLAETAFFLESVKAGVKCGPQDQLAASFGGLRLHEFFPDGTIKSQALAGNEQTIANLEKSLMLFYTGKARSSGKLLENLSNTMEKNAKARKLMAKRVALSYLMVKKIGGNSLNGFGEMLDEDWRLKKEIAPMETNEEIDRIYDLAKKNGAEGGKLVGAGGAGFMLFSVPIGKQMKVKSALAGLSSVKFKFAFSGSEIISGLS